MFAIFAIASSYFILVFSIIKFASKKMARKFKYYLWLWVMFMIYSACYYKESITFLVITTR